MYVLINGKSYRTIKNLKFNIEADVVVIEIPINGFSVEIKTDDEITTATQIDLIDERTSTLWARYWITEALRVDEYYVKVEAESVLMFLDRITMPAEYFDDVTPQYALQQIFSELADYSEGTHMYGWEHTEGLTDYWTTSDAPQVGDALYDNAGVPYPAEITVASYNFNAGYPFITAPDYGRPAHIIEQNDFAPNLDYILPAVPYEIDADLADEWLTQHTGLTGYVPEQSARDRLQWIMLVTGAYIKTFFSDTIEIKKADLQRAAEYIPDSNVFWKPSVKYKEAVTALVIKSYSYTLTQQDPGTTEEWVQDEYGNIYIQTTQEFRLEDTSLPVTTPPNEVVIDNVTLVNANNVNAILGRVATMYFKRMELEASIIDGGQFLPADKVCVINPLGGVFIGFVNSADFIFGKMQKAKLNISEYLLYDNACKLIIIYADEGEEVCRFEYTLPPAYSFSIENVFPEVIDGDTRTIYYPVNEYATGTMEAEGDTIITEVCHPAIRQVKKRLYIYDVDNGTFDDGELRID